MKKRFNHTKRPDYDQGNSREAWEEYEEETYYAEEEEPYEGEEEAYYAEEEEAYGGEEPYGEEEEAYYAEEEEPCEGEEEAYYAEEEESYGEEEAYYAEGEESYEGEEEAYYAEGEESYGEEEEAYYAEEEEACGGEEPYEEEEAYYAEEEEAYGGEEPYEEEEAYYAEEEEPYEGEETYYVEEGESYAGEDEIFYAEEGPYAGNEGYYAREVPYSEGGEIIYEDEDLYNADYRGEQSRSEKGNRKKAAGGLWEKLRSMSVMDRVIAGTGVLVLILALVTGAVLVSSKMAKGQVSDFVSVGNQLDDIELIGRDGLLAVADAQIARMEAANIAMQPEETEPPAEDDEPGYEENEYSRQVSVELNMTSIQKDLKIKFTNEKTGKLVANVPFSVNITDPEGKTSIWSDDDMDGIIYKKDITAGTYKVAMEELSDEKYAGYAVSTRTRSVEVKKDIAYEKVDVDNEVKSEKEVDAKKEDTAQKETVVESVLQDTVAWVESTSVGVSYIEVAKGEIINPLDVLTASRTLDKNFLRMTLPAGVSVNVVSTASTEIKAGGTAQLTAERPNITGDAGENITNIEVINASWSSSQPTVAAVDRTSGLVTGIAAGDAVIQYTATARVTVTEQPADPSVSGGDAAGGEAAPVTKTTDIPVSGQITLKVAGTVLNRGTLTADKTALGLVIKGIGVAKVTPGNFTEGKKLVYKASSDQATVAAVTVDGAGTVTVTGLAAGIANITVTANYEEGGTEETAAKTVITVTVGANKVIELNTAALAYAANPVTINAVIKGASTTAPTVTVESSDTTVMTAAVGTLRAENGGITAPVTLSPLKEGSAVLTVKCLENGEEVKAVCVVTVRKNPKEDRQTPLKDKANRILYVMENGDYRQAVSADYFTHEKFYVKGDVKYTGWQTIGGHVYYFTAEGTAVTGEQVIQGAKYTFASDGTLVTGNGALGIDVSKWNGTIDWNAVKNSGVSYVIIRCGYRGSSKGTLIEDPKFQANIKGATAAGLKVGVYFFTQAVDEREAVEEASMVLGLIKNYKITYPVFLDVESSGGRGDSISKETRTAVCRAFCQTIQNNGYTAGIYANKTWLETKMDAGALSAYKIWLAQYAQTPTYTGRYDLWQYRSTGRVSGISGDVDMNLSYLGY